MSASKKVSRDWTAMHTDALETISSHLPHDVDYVRFRSVCTCWRSAAPKRPQLPWLLARCSPERPNGNHSCSMKLWNFPNTTELFSPPRLPEGLARGKLICGSSRGWVFLLDDAPGISLHNPFTGVHIRLPLISDLPPMIDGNQIRKSVSDQGSSFQISRPDGLIREFSFDRCVWGYYAEHAILSSDPVAAPDDDCVIMVICNHGERLMYCRPGDVSWTFLSPALEDGIQSITFYEGKFYAVYNFRVFVCDIDDASVAEISPADPLFSNGRIRTDEDTDPDSICGHLVVSSGELLLAMSISISFLDSELITWEVFRVDFLDGGMMNLFKLENLGGRSIFFGDSSMLISAGNSAWCRGNCIYYFDRRDIIEVWSMEDGTTTPITLNFHGCWGHKWLTPSLCY